jgi:anaphase-promoting complex subunit 8
MELFLKTFPTVYIYLIKLLMQAILLKVDTIESNSIEFDVAIDLFEKLTRLDPFRYENMDLYSNILYIKGELAYLAYRTFHNDKYRPETCCVIGKIIFIKLV